MATSTKAAAAATRLACVTSVAALALTGCSVSVDPARVLAGALVSFDACDDVLRYLKAEALERVGPYGLGDAGRVAYEDSTSEAAVPGAAGASGDAADGARHSTTNIQEAGVDEPDIVKTDGVHIVSVLGGTLRVVDAAAGLEVGSLDLGGEDRPVPDTGHGGAVAPPGVPIGSQVDAELLLAGDRALVLVEQGFGITDNRLPSPGWGQPVGTALVIVDLSTPAAPREVSRLHVGADLVSARLVDGVARVALRGQPSIVFLWEDGLAEDEDALTERNAAIIEGSELADWLPSSVWTGEGSTEQQLLTPCDRLSYPPAFSGFASVTVLSLPIDGDLREPGATGVLGSGDTVYSSPDRLYVASNDWSSGIAPGPSGDIAPGPSGDIAPSQAQTRTSIHAFDISEPGEARYVGSGDVPGRLIGQYAMSEWDGNLRVASTLSPSGIAEPTSHSRVTVLAEQDGALDEIGMVDGLGRGEQIYAVRYVGATAYVVTFRQTDPLYVVDLTDPTEPVVRGELKINGYSAYLHPVADGRVVGVGQDADASGRQKGAQVSLFDVSNPAAPTRLASEVVRGGWTEAERDARAFLYWADTDDLVIPMNAGDRAGALVLSVDGESVQRRGWVEATGAHGEERSFSVRRSLVVGDRLFTVWDDGIQGNDLSTLEGVSWAPFGS